MTELVTKTQTVLKREVFLRAEWVATVCSHGRRLHATLVIQALMRPSRRTGRPRKLAPI